MRPGVPDVHITDPQDSELAAYRAFSGLALAALVCGLLAALALVDPLLWALPVAGAALGWMALRRIKKQWPALSGRSLAWLGLVLSLVFLVAAPTQWLVYRWQVRAEAREFADMYFKYLAKGEPQKAFQLALAPQQRLPLRDDAQIWGFFRNNQKMRQGLENFVGWPVVKTLLAKRHEAIVRFYETIDQEGVEGDRDMVKQRYAVTYEEGGEKKTFFIDVRMMRQVLPDHTAGWFVVSPGPELVTDKSSIR